MRSLLAALWLLVLAAPAPAQSPAPAPAQSPAPAPHKPGEAVYAVVSLVGDRLLIVSRAMHTGSSIERNDRTWLELYDTSVNEALANAVYDAVGARLPEGRVAILTLRDPKLWAEQNRLAEAGASTQELLDSLKPFLDRVPATHLVLATKVRRDALFEVAGSHVGAGKAEGLGFYIDRQMPLAPLRGFEPVPGFLGVFAFFRLSLVDLRLRKVVREEIVTATDSRVAVDTDDPWDSVSAADKVEALKRLLQDEGGRGAARLFAERGAGPAEARAN